MRQFVTFRLDNQLFGFDVLLVREINPVSEVTPVPQAPAHVRGLVNLRGQIVTVLDLGARLSLGPRTITADGQVVVIRTDGELAAIGRRAGREDLKSSADVVGLLVDAIGDVVAADEGELEAPPPNVAGVEKEFLAGIVKMEDGLLVVLHASEVLGHG
jgi:purine-binding chemotaxis protein CheW